MMEGLSPDAIVNARLKCLDLARSYGGRDEDRLARARAFAAFVLGEAEAVEAAPPTEVSGAASFGLAAALAVSAADLVKGPAE